MELLSDYSPKGMFSIGEQKLIIAARDIPKCKLTVAS